MKKLPKYLMNELNQAIEKAKDHKNQFDGHYNDWEIDVSHWGTPPEHLSYYGKSLNEALELIPATYSHTKKMGAELIVIMIKMQKLDQNEDIIDTHWIYELELTK